VLSYRIELLQRRRMLSIRVSLLFECLRRKTDGTDPLNVVASYYCTVVNGKKGCCRDGKICTSGGGDDGVSSGGGDGECTNSGYVPCAGDDFCCRACSYSHSLPIHSHSREFSRCSVRIHLLPRWCQHCSVQPFLELHHH